MESVAELLDTGRKNHSLRQALVRLWVLASQTPLLNSWEQQANEGSIEPQVRDFFDQLQDGSPLELAQIQAHPLALIRALDDHLASARWPSCPNKPEKFKVDGQHHWLVPVTLGARRRARVNTQSARQARWFHHHAVLPGHTAQGIEVVCLPTGGQLDTRLGELADQAEGQLKVWIAHFDDGADVVWDRSISPIRNWHSQGVADHASRRASMLHTLTAAKEAGAHIVVFPEFTLDLEHRKQLAAHLRRNPGGLLLVVAGAFHETAKVGAHPPYNTAPVLDADGHPLFAHQKLCLFGDSDVGFEFALVGSRLHVLVSPVGSMTVLICKDFVDVAPRVATLLDEVPLDWVWVPSYGNETTLRLHKERASKLAQVRTGTSCVVAQTQNTAMRKPGQTQALLPGFGHAAGDAQPSDVPAAGGLVAFALTRQAPPGLRPALKRVK